MRFLHVSDLHIGKRVNGMPMIADQEHILRQIVDIVRDREADAIVIAGDIYDKASPSAEAVSVFDAFLTDLAQLGVRVLAVPGNHDSAERIAYAQGLLAHQGVSFPPVYSGEIDSVSVSDEHGQVTFWLVPFLKPGDVRRFFPDLDIGDDYAAALRAALERCDIDRQARNVAVSHQLVTAAGKAPERADDEIKLGGIDNVDVSVYSAFDYVALGHVHRPQRVGRDSVRYSGSPLKYSFSEARYDKSAVLVDLGSKNETDEVGECVSFELVPLVPLHDMREVRMSLAELLAEGLAARESREDEAVCGDDAEAGTAGCTDDVPEPAESPRTEGAERADGEDTLVRHGNFTQDYLHVTLTDEHPQIDAMARVRDLFPNAMTLDYDNAALLATRTKARTAVDPDALDTVELFARFYEEQTGKPLDDVQTELVSKVARKADETVSRGEGETEGGAR